MNKLRLSLILTVIFLFGCGKSFAQWSGWNRFTFEASDTVWRQVITIDTVNYHHNLWQVGKPHKAPFDTGTISNVLITDTTNLCVQNDTSVFIITLPGHINLPYVRPWLDNMSFQYQLSIDTDSHAFIEFSSDTGKTWFNLNDTIPNGIHQYDTIANTTGWRYGSIMFDPSYDYHRDSLMLRFKLITGNDTPARAGWMIDDIYVTYEYEGVEQPAKDKSIIVYPNPVSGLLYLRSSDVISSVEIINMVGQAICSNGHHSKDVSIDTSVLPSGMYFVRIDNNTIRRFVKQ